MMRKFFFMICIILISSVTIGGTCACSGKSDTKNQTSSVNDVLAQGMAAEDSKNTESTAQPAESITPADQPDTGNKETSFPEPLLSAEPTPEVYSEVLQPAEGIDVDLTILSSTMVYSEVYNMLSAPEDYIGKTVKMKGPLVVYHDNTTGNVYFACLIQDATACCAQGLEFVLTDDYKYPDDYPEDGSEICVIGIFDTYKEGNLTYCTLREAKLV